MNDQKTSTAYITSVSLLKAIRTICSVCILALNLKNEGKRRQRAYRERDEIDDTILDRPQWCIKGEVHPKMKVSYLVVFGALS